MRTFFSMSRVRSMASAFDTLRWRTMPSAIWSPMVKAGLSEVIGSWKIMAIRSPRRSARSRSVSVSRSWPSNRAEPDTIRAGVGRSPMRASEVTLLPQPDSPTMHRVLPLLTEKDTSSTTFTPLGAPSKRTESPSTLSNGGSAANPTLPGLRVSIIDCCAASSPMETLILSVFRYCCFWILAVGQGARHDFQKPVAHKLEVFAHGLFRCVGLALGDGCDHRPVLIHICLLPGA